MAVAVVVEGVGDVITDLALAVEVEEEDLEVEAVEEEVEEVVEVVLVTRTLSQRARPCCWPCTC